jgi:hypothetical protein
MTPNFLVGYRIMISAVKENHKYSSKIKPAAVQFWAAMK